MSATRAMHNVVVVGLGTTGLPMAVAAADAGHHVVGVDASEHRVRCVADVSGHFPMVDPENLRNHLRARRLRVQTTRETMPVAGRYVVCVPTPLGPAGAPDLAYLVAAGGAIAEAMPPGCLVAVQSTCPPGTIRGVVATALETVSGMTAGRDFHLAHLPAPMDAGHPGPGPGRRDVRRVVAGLTPRCTELAAEFAGRLAVEVVTVSSVDTAEMTKVFENTFRMVNLSLVNELAEVCRGTGAEATEVIRAAALTPFAGRPRVPGIGVDGAGIPAAARFFLSTARRQGRLTPLVDAALAINETQPGRTIARLETLVAGLGGNLADSHVLVVGVTHEPDVPDARLSAAVRILEQLRRAAAEIAYHDPHVPALQLADGTVLESRPLSADDLGDVDLAVVLTVHAATDVARLARLTTTFVCADAEPRLADTPLSGVLQD
jgi:UDP-N-acetyl-D-glucosamine dehydrogenase